MTIKTVSFTLTDFAVPEGTVVSGYEVSVGPSIIPQTVQAGASASFDLPAGTYTATVVALDAKSQPVGPIVSSDPFTVPGGTVTVLVPAAVTVA